MKIKITLFLICLFLISSAGRSQIKIDENKVNWSKIEDATPIVIVNSDDDNGDGFNDGAIQLKSSASTPAIQGLQYLLSGSPVIGEAINLETKHYQLGTSYVKFKMQLYNATDNIVLAQTAEVFSNTTPIGTLTLSYTFTPTNVGKQITIRFIRVDDLNPVRAAALDYLSVNGKFVRFVPLPPIGQLVIDNYNDNWSKIENTTAVTIVTTDADNGDGLNDGAIQLKSTANTPAVQGLQYLLSGSPIDREQINLETKYYQIGASYVKFKMQLYNATDNLVLAETAEVFSNTTPIGTLTLSYTFTPANVGKQIKIRFIRVDDLNPVRAAALDYLKVNGEFVNLVPIAPAAQLRIDDNIYNWSKIEDAGPVTLVYNDVDNGDGTNDGAVLVKGTANTPALQGLQYLLYGSPVNKEQINLEVKYYQYATSNVKFKMQVYNVTDNLVLAETLISSTPTDVGTATLLYAFTAASLGDQIIVRFVRADDLNVVRVAALDYLKVNGQFVNMNQLCKPTFNFDLPLITATAEEINELKAIRSSLSDQILGAAPSQTLLNNAIAQYDALNITVIGNKITGESITDINQIDFLHVFARRLKYYPEDTAISDRAVKAVWYLSSLNCAPKSNSVLTFYNFPKLSKATIFLNSYLPENIKDLFGNALYNETEGFEHLFNPNYDPSSQTSTVINTDIIYMDLDVLFAYADWFKTDDEKIRYLKTLKRYLERFLNYTYGQKDGLKKDGLGYHHNTSYDGYMYAYATVATVLKSLDNTSFQIDKPSYLRFREAVYAQAMYSNDSGVKPFAMAGRNPQNKNSTLSAATLANTAIAGEKILGLTTADTTLAGLYNRKYGVGTNGDKFQPQFKYNNKTPFEEGFIQFNSGNLGIYRKNNWVASMKGQSDVLFGSEIYVSQNRFGRYQGYGALEILYPGNSETGNGYSVIGWNWNYNPGTTTIVLPWDKLHAEKGRVDEFNTYGFAGSLALTQIKKDVLSNTTGQSGLFSMKFKERDNLGFGTVTHGPNTHNATFEFTKTYFAIDNYIICLGTGIKNNDTVNPTVTTLFQRLNNNSNGVFVNGDNKGNEISASFEGTAANWIIDNYNTGYYILPSSGTLKIKNATQTMPYQDQVAPSDATISTNASNKYRLAYLDHGKAPENNSYEFVCIPSADPAKMIEFSQKMQSAEDKPYVVHKNIPNQQIIEHKSSKTWAYALPSGNAIINDGIIKANDQPCLAMYKGNDENFTTLVLSVSNPDLGLSPSTPKIITLTLKNNWNISNINEKVSCISATETETVIQFTTADGLPVEINLALANPVKLAVHNSNEVINQSSAILYPNPVHDKFQVIVSELEENAIIYLYDITGKRMKQIQLTNISQEVSVAGLPAGIYFVVIQNGSETLKNKIIKQ